MYSAWCMCVCTVHGVCVYVQYMVYVCMYFENMCSTWWNCTVTVATPTLNYIGAAIPTPTQHVRVHASVVHPHGDPFACGCVYVLVFLRPTSYVCVHAHMHDCLCVCAHSWVCGGNMTDMRKELTSMLVYVHVIHHYYPWSTIIIISIVYCHMSVHIMF